MDPSPDELAGVVDLFGALTRAELHQAFVDLAARTGASADPDALDDRIDEAISAYALVALPGDEGRVLAAGPIALPILPPHAADLPHILTVDERPIDRERAGEAVRERLRADAERAVAAGDREAAARLLDVCYDVDAWAPVEVDGVRERLAAAVE